MPASAAQPPPPPGPAAWDVRAHHSARTVLALLLLLLLLLLPSAVFPEEIGAVTRSASRFSSCTNWLMQRPYVAALPMVQGGGGRLQTCNKHRAVNDEPQANIEECTRNKSAPLGQRCPLAASVNHRREGCGWNGTLQQPLHVWSEGLRWRVGGGVVAATTCHLLLQPRHLVRHCLLLIHQQRFLGLEVRC